jgi:hypothetical protein
MKKMRYRNSVCAQSAGICVHEPVIVLMTAYNVNDEVKGDMNGMYIMQMEVKNAYTIVFKKKTEERIPIWKPRHRWDDCMKVVPGEMDCENVD